MRTSNIEQKFSNFENWSCCPLSSFENSNDRLLLESGIIYCFRNPADQPGPEGETTLLEKEAEDQAPEEEEYILCRQCRQAITRPDDRLSIQGAHRHTFANPHGIVFDIGCFRRVIGCGYAGAASDEFTWFAGYNWRVCYCTMCLTHLGWIFGSKAGDNFHGLIMDRLIEPG
jgi:hypothetical protein